MEYLKIGDVWKEKYSEKVYKISLSAGCTCPNRDGTKGVGGCIFCSEKGSGDFAQSGFLPIAQQIEQAKRLVAKKGGKKFIAYFQSYTNTYGDVKRLEKIFTEAASMPEIVEIAIATRCDCLGEDVIQMLDRLNKIKPVTVELGLQSANPETLKKINCCYTAEDFEKRVKLLKEHNIHVVAHIILGFPWESREDMVQSARFVAESGADGIKLQLLHYLKGTKMGEDYLKYNYPTMTLEEYAALLGDCLNALPAGMEIHRLTGDGAKKDLLAPLWTGDKRKTMNYISNYIKSLKDERRSL